CDTFFIFMPPVCPAGPPGADSAFGAALAPPAPPPEAPPPAPCAAATVHVPASRAAASSAVNFVFMSLLRFGPPAFLNGRTARGFRSVARCARRAGSARAIARKDAQIRIGAAATEWLCQRFLPAVPAATRRSAPRGASKTIIKGWCGREDSNLHELPR